MNRSCKPGALKKRAGLIYSFLIAVILLSTLACDLTISPVTGVPATQTNQAVSNSGSSQNFPPWLTVYFTDPDPPDNMGHGIDQYVVAVLNNASVSIDAASLDLNLPGVVNALVRASQRGVIVRVVYDSENGNLELDNALTNNKKFDAIKALRSANIALVDGGYSSGLMHDKMIIVDGLVLFMGSWNLSYNDTYRNNNNLLEITDPRLIANYQAKFNEMFIDKRFGTKAGLQAPFPSLNIGGTQVENYFAPEDDVMAKLVSYVQSAEVSVHFMAYAYTHPDLSTAMIKQAAAGIQVEGVIEHRNAAQGVFSRLFCSGISVETDGNPYNMHHKVIIIDRQIVITGSFNFTKSADTINDENVLVIHSPVVAALFEQEFQRIYDAGETPSASDVCQ